MLDKTATAPKRLDIISMNGVDLKSTLLQRGLTQYQLSTAWGYSEEHISRWITGKAPIPAWVPYALGLKVLSEREYPVAVKITPKLADDLGTTDVVATEMHRPAKPVQVPIDCSPAPVPGKWRFGTFYPD